MRSHVLSGGLLPDSPDESLLARVLPSTYLVVACPFCKSAPGRDCSTPNYSTALSTHAARKRAVRQLSDIERYRLFAQRRAEHVAARAATEAFLAKPLTAEQQASRAAITAAFDQARDEFRVKERAMYARCRDPWIHNDACRCRNGQPYVAPVPKPRVVRDVTDLTAVRARKAGVR